MRFRRTVGSARVADRATGIVCAVLAVVLFASFTVVSRMGLTSTSLTLPDLALLRFGVAGLILLPVLYKRGLESVRWWQAVHLAMTGGLGFALFAYTGFRFAPASHGGVLLHGTIPLFTFALAWRMKWRRPTTDGWGGLILILVGVVTIAFDSGKQSAAHQWMGDAALLVAALCWSAYGLSSQQLKLEPLHAVAIVATGSLIGYLPIYLLLTSSNLTAAPWHDIVIQSIFQGVLIGIVSGLLYIRAVVSLGAQLTAVFTAGVPCLTTFAALGLLDERPSWWVWGGVGLVTVGMLVRGYGRGHLPASLKCEG